MTELFDDVPQPVHDIRTGWVGGPPDFPMPVEVWHFATAFGDWDIQPIVGEGGAPGYRFRQCGIYTGGDGTWGCATCEQTHPIEVKSCPLIGRATVRVAVGPFSHDGGQVTYVGMECVEGSFTPGVVKAGVGVYVVPQENVR